MVLKAAFEKAFENLGTPLIQLNELVKKQNELITLFLKIISFNSYLKNRYIKIYNKFIINDLKCNTECRVSNPPITHRIKKVRSTAIFVENQNSNPSWRCVAPQHL
jgi:hypothetical protein